MKKLRVYDVYLDDGRDCFKVTVPAENKKDAESFTAGNGEVIAIRDCDLQDIDLGCLADTLTRCGWGQKEVDVITRCLARCGLDRN